MNHLGTQRLGTDRLILRPFVAEDIPHAFRNWVSDPDVTAYLTWPAHPDIGVTEHVVRDWLSRYPSPDYYQWAIELKSLGQPSDPSPSSPPWRKDRFPSRQSVTAWESRGGGRD